MREGYLRSEIRVTVCVMVSTCSSVCTNVEELVGVDDDDDVVTADVEVVVVPATIESINATPRISPFPLFRSVGLTSQLHPIKRFPRCALLFLLYLPIQRLHPSNIRRQHLPLDVLEHPAPPYAPRPCRIVAFPCRS